jgi:hypothetical protein
VPSRNRDRLAGLNPVEEGGQFRLRLGHSDLFHDHMIGHDITPRYRASNALAVSAPVLKT